MKAALLRQSYLQRLSAFPYCRTKHKESYQFWYRITHFISANTRQGHEKVCWLIFLLAENCVDSGSGLGGRDGSVLNGHGDTPAKMAEGDSLILPCCTWPFKTNMI